MGALLAFRARRDAWVLVAASLAIISELQTNRVIQERTKLTSTQVFGVALGVILSLFSFGYYRKISEASLKAHVAKIFPADAVPFVQKNKQPGPHYNHLDCDAYLICAVP